MYCTALNSAVAVRSNELRNKDHVLSAAEKEFNELDTDNDGHLDSPEELLGLADWVWDQFHPNGAPLDDDERKQHADVLLKKLDDDMDQMLNFTEFEHWSVNA